MNDIADYQDHDDVDNDDAVVRDALLRLIKLYGIEAVIHAVEELDPRLLDRE